MLYEKYNLTWDDFTISRDQILIVIQDILSYHFVVNVFLRTISLSVVYVCVAYEFYLYVFKSSSRTNEVSQ